MGTEESLPQDKILTMRLMEKKKKKGKTTKVFFRYLFKAYRFFLNVVYFPFHDHEIGKARCATFESMLYFFKGKD